MPSREQIADRITELLIEHFNTYATYPEAGIVGADLIYQLPYFQKVVRDGRIQVATLPHRTDDEGLVLYRSDVKGNEADIKLLNFIYNTYFADPSPQGPLVISDIRLYVEQSPTGAYNDIITLIVDDDIIEVNNGSLSETFYQDNLGQFVNFSETHSAIDSDKATQILDTNIYELYPSELTKQQRINRFFREYEDLKWPDSPRTLGAISDNDGDQLTDTFNDDTANNYHFLYDITGAPMGDREDSYITWRNDDAIGDSENEGKTLQYIYDDLQANYFLQEDLDPEVVDRRPKYRSQSSGYLKVRTLNQAIIVRNEESGDIGLIGPDDTNPIWQTSGFTITMWVRFLDKVNGGTLFNFGNPLRDDSPAGFMLETFVVERENYINTNDGADYFENDLTFGGNGFFLEENVERFVRLIVRDAGGELRDSHVGNSFQQRIDTSALTSSTIDDWAGGVGVNPFNYTLIPIDLTEWYFIVATYDPVGINEDTSHNYTAAYLPGGCGDCHGGVVGWAGDNCNCDPNFWRGNIEQAGYIDYSGLGAKCKVEIISRTDLLRARGFKE